MKIDATAEPSLQEDVAADSHKACEHDPVRAVPIENADQLGFE
jgi:hypothetical protein